jgi:hypothetical protein
MIHGSGLAEVLVALGVIVPVIVVAVGIFPFSWLVGQQASSLSFAQDVAAARIESARATAFDEIASSRAEVVRDTRGNDYQCVTTATPQGSMLKRLTVTVTWTDKKSERLQIVTCLVRTAPAE